MRHARILPPRRRRSWRIVPACALAFAGWGCQQPPYCFYYGYGAPPCAPVAPAPVAAQGGTICDPPAAVIDGPTTSSNVGRSTTNVTGASGSSRVVVSEPEGQPRSFWKRARPEESVATTSVEGAESDTSVNR